MSVTALVPSDPKGTDMTKLNDTQLLILNAAAQRDDGGVAVIVGAKGQKAAAALLKTGLLNTGPKDPDLAVWQPLPGKPGMALSITPAGLAALGIDGEAAANAAPAATKPPKASRTTASRSKKPTASPKRGAAERANPATPTRRLGKIDSLVSLMRRASGATLADLMTATNWQAHSVRGAISGAIKKRLGLAVTSERIGDSRTYRIAR
jgi:hypothetical protein